MELSDVAIKARLASAIHELSGGIVESELSYKESLSCVISKPKIQLLALTENIEAAESNYDAIKMQWDRMKSMHMAEDHIEPMKSQSSLCDSSTTLEVVKSKHQLVEDRREEENPNNQVQVVLTPRVPKTETDVVPIINVQGVPSFNSIKTNKRVKKNVKTKKKAQVSEDLIRTSKIYSAPSRRKNIYGRLRNSNSKSTIATRETSFSDRRRFRQQKMPSLRKRSNMPKFRVEPKEKNFAKTHSKNIESKSLFSSRQPKYRSVANPLINEETIQVMENTVDMSNMVEQDIVEEKFEVEDKPAMKKHKCRNSPIRTTETKESNREYYEQSSQRNYEMPTVASKMKRIHRPYYHRFNIRNIPFVVGMSITPSHNLRLNIQQMLGIIKIKQPTVPGISSLLIQKVRRGAGPVSLLFQQINKEFARSCRNLSQDCNFSHKNRFESNHSIGSFSFEHLRPTNSTSQAPFYKPNLACEPLYEEDEEFQSTSLNFRAKSQALHRQEDKRMPRKQSRRIIPTEDTTGDSITGCDGINHLSSSNTKETTEVFTRLYDQFKKMITQQNRLKEQFDKRKDDKALMKEISEMEESIQEKQQEITTVVNLYKEVMSLKQQMRQLRERNSFVCISSQEPRLRQVSGLRSRISPLLDSKCNIIQTPNTLQLAGLLRQMQAFQRQLKLS